MPTINDFLDVIDPAFINQELAGTNAYGGGDIDIKPSGGVIIESLTPIEVPMANGQIAIFNSNGEFLGYK